MLHFIISFMLSFFSFLKKKFEGATTMTETEKLWSLPLLPEEVLTATGLAAYHFAPFYEKRKLLFEGHLRHRTAWQTALNKETEDGRTPNNVKVKVETVQACNRWGLSLVNESQGNSVPERVVTMKKVHLFPELPVKPAALYNGKHSTVCQDAASEKKRLVSIYSHEMPAETNQFSCFHNAYCNHQSLQFDDGDVWLMVCSVISKIIEENADKMRDVILNDPSVKEKIKLTVVTDANGLTVEEVWTDFATRMLPEIKKHANPVLVDTLHWPHSTKLHETLSSLSVMNASKHYFDFCHCILGCGIRNIYFSGTHWEEILVRLHHLKNIFRDVDLGPDVDVIWYLNSMTTIVERFIMAMNGEADLKWWASIVDSFRQHVGSGGGYNEWVSGWILVLFGKSSPTKAEELVLPLFNVPVEVDDRIARNKYDVELIGGFIGSTRVDNYFWTHQPEHEFARNFRIARNELETLRFVAAICEQHVLSERLQTFKGHEKFKKYFAYKGREVSPMYIPGVSNHRIQMILMRNVPGHAFGPAFEDTNLHIEIEHHLEDVKNAITLLRHVLVNVFDCLQDTLPRKHGKIEAIALDKLARNDGDINVSATAALMKETIVEFYGNTDWIDETISAIQKENEKYKREERSVVHKNTKVEMLPRIDTTNGNLEDNTQAVFRPSLGFNIYLK